MRGAKEDMQYRAARGMRDVLPDEIPFWELLEGAANPFSAEQYLAANQTPVFFGSAVNNFGVRELLDAFVELAPAPGPRPTATVWSMRCLPNVPTKRHRPIPSLQSPPTETMD